MAQLFDEYFIVEEKTIKNFVHEYGILCDQHRCCHECTKNSFEIKTKFREMTQFAALEFNMHKDRLEIKDIGNVSQMATDVPLAQIILWQWNNARGTQEIKETKILSKGGAKTFNAFASSSPAATIVIRILQKRQPINENPRHSCEGDKCTVRIRNSQITVSAAWLMAVSPVINRMLNTEMTEKQQRLITLDNLGAEMEQFTEFLRVISVNALQSPVFPNPTKLIGLLKLADYFQVDWLKTRCEASLINCVEIPLIDRFLLIEPYNLNNFQAFFMNLDICNLRTFIKANHEQITPTMCKRLLTRICG